MRIVVDREACCAQDDQLGPLDAAYELSSGATFGDLVDAIVASRFLQYSSSHVTLQGEVDGRPVVRVHSPSLQPARGAEFVEAPTRSLSDVVGTRPLRFRFVFD